MKITRTLAFDLLNGTDGRVAETNPNIVCIKVGCWEDGGKYDYQTIIFLDMETNKYYSLKDSRSGSYYSDYWFEHSEWSEWVECGEVEPYEFTQTRYRTVNLKEITQ